MDKRLQIKLLLGLIGFLERHPLLVRLFLKPFANAPFLSRKLMVLPRAYMGATAFDIHDVDLPAGRIGIGGVEEIMAGAKIIHLLHTTLADHLDEKEKAAALYNMGVALCTWEVTCALEGGRWAPSFLVPLIANSQILDQVRTDPLMAKFFTKTMNMMSRLITDEGGWGHLDFDFSAAPMQVFLSNSQEARWLGPSPTPVCHFYAGIVAGYAGTISGKTIRVKEVACSAMGAEKCVFHLFEE
ncbi:4-vinyl reductase [Desulfosudis oleivorans]|uniref:4-vinyl reductase 4VR n=1 Tax=Desulfosudis oleivorans (strain DSM 6200 / JCM 39069 / Hxd3) TaxID=96561 RepID=A8ZUT9_DESOH|nr:4-vinyl reductase [Desulfosudis oleivorans]ABW66502.1 4-vinyl reductase 4VR [Desulfosudis oleivorans Hxd3]